MKTEKDNDYLSIYTRKDGKKLFLSVDSAQTYDENGDLLISFTLSVILRI